MSVMMTDMKTKTVSKKSAKRSPVPTRRTFTVRDLNRQPQAVLNAARQFGKVHVQSRTGERFELKPEMAKPIPQESVREHLDRLKALQARMRADGQGFTAEGWETFSKMLAGE